MKIIEATTVDELSDKIGSLTIPPQTLIRVIIEEIRTGNRDSGKMLQKRDDISKKKLWMLSGNLLPVIGIFPSVTMIISQKHTEHGFEVLSI